MLESINTMNLHFKFMLAVMVSIVNLHVCPVMCDCMVDNLQLQENFDLDRFAGKWYEHKWYTDADISDSDMYTDFIHYYTPTDTGNITNYVSWRYPRSEECDFAHGTLIPTDAPGHFTRISEQGDVSSYLVLDTDYTQYALTYTCIQVSESGTCQNAMAWVWGRSPVQLPDSLSQRLDSFYTNICLNQSDFFSLVHTNECKVPRVYNMTPEQSCRLDSFSVEDLDKTQFAGVWYEMHWLTQDEMEASLLLTNFMYEFITLDDSRFTIYMRGRRDGCSYSRIKFEETSTPGQYNYEGAITGYDFKLPSWIIATDYENYAVQFSCRNITDGVCTMNELIVWSRRPTLAPEYMKRVNTVVQDLCLNPVAAFTITQNNVCPPWQDAVCETNASMDLKSRVSVLMTLTFMSLLGFLYI